MVDIDGTLALRTERGPYDWESAGSDAPNEAVVTTVQALVRHPAVGAIIALSGRHEIAREITSQWLTKHDIPFDELLMRANGDYRSDDVVKEEIFRRHIEPRYRVVAVIDDRDQVVKMWRRIGLICFQVAEGLF